MYSMLDLAIQCQHVQTAEHAAAQQRRLANLARMAACPASTPWLGALARACALALLGLVGR